MDASYRSVIWFGELLVKIFRLVKKHEFKVNSKFLCIILNDQWKLFLFAKRKKGNSRNSCVYLECSYC